MAGIWGTHLKILYSTAGSVTECIVCMSFERTKTICVALVKKAHDFEDNLLLGNHLLTFYFNEYSNEKLHVWFVKLVLKSVT